MLFRSNRADNLPHLVHGSRPHRPLGSPFGIDSPRPGRDVSEGDREGNGWREATERVRPPKESPPYDCLLPTPQILRGAKSKEIQVNDYECDPNQRQQDPQAHQRAVPHRLRRGDGQRHADPDPDGQLAAKIRHINP